MDMNTLVLLIILVAVIYILIKRSKISSKTRENTMFYFIDYEDKFLPRLKFDKLFKHKESLENIDVFLEMLQKFLDAKYNLYYVGKTIKQITDVKSLSHDEIAELFFKSINDCKSDIWMLISKKELKDIRQTIQKTYNTKNNYYLNFTIEQSISMFVMYSSDGVEFLFNKDSVDEEKIVKEIVENSKMKYRQG
ncbi:MAG: hypothetical protein HRT43_03525 [Campylobacteraceae bacterium]|nr:hypothetical protein [Campylobacteraceae bacterium]